jgi:hypothetical protein
MNSRAVAVGWIFLTLGVAVGAIRPRRRACSHRTIEPGAMSLTT